MTRTHSWKHNDIFQTTKETNLALWQLPVRLITITCIRVSMHIYVLSPGLLDMVYMPLMKKVAGVAFQLKGNRQRDRYFNEQMYICLDPDVCVRYSSSPYQENSVQTESNLKGSKQFSFLVLIHSVPVYHQSPAESTAVPPIASAASRKQ